MRIDERAIAFRLCGTFHPVYNMASKKEHNDSDPCTLNLSMIRKKHEFCLVLDGFYIRI